MRRSPVPRAPISLTAAEVGRAPWTGRTSPWRAAARSAAVLLVWVAVAGCMRVGEPAAPRPSPSAERLNGGAVVEAPPRPAGGMGGAPRPGSSADDDAAGKNGDESPSASASPSRGESTSRPRPRPSVDPSSPAASGAASQGPSASESPTETGSADSEAPPAHPGGSAARNVP